MCKRVEEQELTYSILEELNMVGDIIAKQKIEGVLEVYKIIKTTSIQYCQSCGEIHFQKQLRVVK